MVPQIGRVPLECKWNCGLKIPHHNNKENKEKVSFFCIVRERRNNFVCCGRAGMDNLFEIKSLILPEQTLLTKLNMGIMTLKFLKVEFVD